MPWGSNTPTGPRSARARRVALMLSGLVDVVMTAPGASRIALIATCRPLPDPGGSDDEDAALARRPHVLAAGGAEEVADVGGCGPVEARAQGAGLGHERLARTRRGGRPRWWPTRPGCRTTRPGASVRRRGSGAAAGPARQQQSPGPRRRRGAAPCSDGWDAGDVRRAGRGRRPRAPGANAWRRVAGGDGEDPAGARARAEQQRRGRGASDDDGLLDRERARAGSRAGWS